MFRLIIIASLLVVIGGGTYIAYTRPSSLPSQIQPFAPQLKSSIDTGLHGIQTAMGNTKNAAPAVLGVKSETSRIFQEDTNGKPIHQKAMEYTQYQYCKMVVKGYEDDLTPTPEKQ
ncbi:MAG: hypothetical protein ABI425_01715 [Patescibacteria group bacterium]